MLWQNSIDSKLKKTKCTSFVICLVHNTASGFWLIVWLLGRDITFCYMCADVHLMMSILAKMYSSGWAVKSPNSNQLFSVKSWS